MKRIKSFLPYIFLTAVIMAALCAAVTLMSQSSERQTAEAATDNSYFTFELSSDSSYYIIKGCTYTGTSITIPSIYNGLSVKEIGSGAFYGLSMQSVTISSRINTIGASAFYNCTSLTSVTMGDSVVHIGERAFGNCTALKSITIPADTSDIGSSVFMNCTSLTTFTVDDENQWYKAIDGNLYNYNGTELIQYAGGKSATSFTTPDNVTNIGSYAFYGAESLTSVTLSSAVNYITEYAFVGFSGTQIIFNNTYGWYRNGSVEMNFTSATTNVYNFTMYFNNSYFINTDDVAPTITNETSGNVYSDVNSSPSYHNGSVTISYSDVGQGIKTAYYGFASGTGYPSSINTSFSSGTTFDSAGRYLIVIEDRAGNSSSYYFIIDKTSPTLTSSNIKYTSSNTNYTNVTFEVTTSDNFVVSSLYYKSPTATAYTQSSDESSVSIAATSGDGLWEFYCIDKAGNQSATYYVYLDTGAPTMTLYAAGSSVNSGSYVKTSNIYASASDSVCGISTIYYKTANTSYDTYTSGTKLTDEAVYTFYCVDNVGNQSVEYTVTLDRTAPTLEASNINYTSGSNYYTNVDFTVTATDNFDLYELYYKISTASDYTKSSSASSVSIASTSGDGLWYFYSIDKAGNQSATYSVYLDTGAPIITLYAGRNTTSSGSYTTASYVYSTAADSISGVSTIYYKTGTTAYDTYTSETHLTGEAVYTFYCVDNVGNQSTEYTVTIDRTAPVLTFTGINYTSGTTYYAIGAFSFTVSDFTSTTISASQDGGTATSTTGTSWSTTAPASNSSVCYAFTVTDAAGNSTSYTVYQDTIKPTITLYAGGSAVSSGSYTNASNVSATAADSVSGVATIYYKSGSGNYASYNSGTKLTAEAVYTFYCVDNVGNQSSEYTVTLDYTAPVLTFTGINYTSGTTYYAIGAFSFTVSDFTTTTISTSQNGGTATTTTGTSWSTTALASNSSVCYAFTVTDQAGNSTAYTVYQDTIKPTITLYASSSVISSGSYTNASNISATAADTVSGVAIIYYKTASGSYTAYTSGTKLTAEEVYSFYCVDNVGNQSTVYTLTLDLTAPTLSSADIKYTSGSSRYTNGTFTVSASDNYSLSTLYYKISTASTYTQASSSSSVTISATAGNGLWYFYSIDSAGNQSATYSVYLDTGAPTITLYAAGSAVSSGSYTNASNVSAKASDSISGVATIYYKSGSGSYAAYTSGTTLTAEAVYTFYCVDNVGNQSATYTVTLDYTAATLAASNIKYTSGSNRYTNGAFTVTATDNFDLYELYYKISTATNYTKSSSASSVSIAATSGDGLWYFYSIDKAGNQSSIYSVYLDTGTPTITLYADGSSVSSGSYVKTSNVSAKASDTISGVATIYYKSGSGSYAAYSSGTTLTAEAVYTFYCVDNVGNRSATYTVTLDYTAASLAASNINYTSGSNRYTNGAFTVTATDNFDLYELYYKISTATNYTKSSSASSVSIAATSGDGLWYFYSVDKAGNQSSIYSVYLDTGTPTITLYAAGSAVSSGSYVKTSNVSATAADTISGVATIYYKSGNGSYAAYSSGTTLTAEAVYTFYCVDNVGNQSSTYTVTLDYTAPVLTFTGINYTSGTTLYAIGAFSFSVSDFTTTTISTTKDGGTATTTTGTSWSSAAISSNLSVCYAFTVTDQAGNSTSYTVYQDTIKPTITLYAGGSTVSSGSYVKTSNVSATASDSVSGVSAIYYKSGSGSFTSYTSGTTLTAEAVYTFYCVDNVGNQSVEYIVTLDYTAPALTFTGINYTNGSTLYTNAAFSFSVADFTSTTISASQDGGTAAITTDTSWSSAAPSNDVAITYALTVTDQAGNSTSYTVYVYNRSTFGNVDLISASYSVGSWYETALPSKYFASNSAYPAGTYYFADYASAYAFALAAELSRATATSNGWSYSSTANASTFIEYTDYNSLYTAAEYYAVTRISDRKLMSQTGKGADNSDGSLTVQDLTCPSLLSDYSAYNIYYISKSYAFTQPTLGVTGNTRYAYAQYLSDGYSLRIGDQISLTYETKLSTVLGNANCYYQGYYLITEYDLCGNTQIYIVYIDLEAPALTVAVTYGNGTEENITYTEDYISSYSGIMRYAEFRISSIIDNMDSWTFIIIEGSSLSSTYLYSDDLPVLSYENGYYGSYTITVYDRSANTLSFSVSIAGEAPTITTSSLTNETRVRVTVTISDSNNVLTQIHLYKVSYSGEYTEMYYDDDGTALSTSTLVYTLRTGGKYVMVVVDAYGRTVNSGAFFYMKDLPSGTLSGVSDGGLTNGDVTFKYSNSYSVVLYIYVDSSWVTAESALYAQTVGSSYTTIAISASESTCYEYLIFLYVTDDMNLFVEYTFEIDCIAPSVTIMTAEVGEIFQGDVTRYAFYVTWTETDLTVRYSTSRNATTTTKYTKNTYMTSAGTYYFTVKDTAGNTLSFEIVIDNIVSYTLSGTYILYDEGYVSQKSLTLTVNEQIGSWECVSNNGIEVINGQTITANGIYEFTVTDIYENSLSITLIIDNIAPDPVITTEDGISLSAGDSVNKAFHVTCDEANSVITYSANGSSYSAYSGDYLSAEGAHYFRITDKYGNYSLFTITCDYAVKYTVSGDYSLITDVYYISKASLTLTVNETYMSFVVVSNNELTFTSGERVATEGVYQVTITDAAGNVAEVTLEIDKTAPTPTITTEGGVSLEAGSSINQAFVVTCVESTATITYSANGTSYAAYDGGYLSDAGTHYFRITDVAGNKTEFNITCDYVVKYTLSGNYNTVEDNYYISKSSLTLTVSESYVSFSVSSNNGVTFADGEKVSTEGVYIVTIADLAGNVLALTLEIDKTAPTPIITAEDGGSIAANGSVNQAFVVTCAETSAAVTYSANGSSYAAYSGDYLSAEGAHYFKITDLAGNVTEFTVTCDYAVKYTLSGSYNTVEDNYYISKSSFTLTINETYTSFAVTSNNETTFASGDKVTTEGVYQVTITDVAGNVLALTLEIDKTAPEPIITAEDGTIIAVNGSINQAFVVTGETGATITYSASGTGYAAYDGGYLSAEGAHYFKITDLAGNVTEFTVTCDYAVKYTLSGSYNTVADNYYISKASLTLTVNETYASFVVTSNNETTFTSGDKVTTEGVYQVTITDAAGNVLALTLEIDKTVPTPTITAEDGTLLEAGGSVNKAFAVTCIESTATITYSTTGAAYAAYGGEYLSEANVYYFKITDLAGNVAEFTVTCDYAVKYSISGTYNIITDNYYISKSALTLTVSETYTSFSVSSENGVTFGSGEKVTTEGVYIVTITDAAGNILTVTLEIDKTAPEPIITAEDGTVIAANGSINQAFNVTSEAGATITCAVGATSSYAAYNGEYYSAINVYYFRIVDIAGNKTEFTVTCDYSVSYTVSGDYSIINENYYISKTALTLTVNESYTSFEVTSKNALTFSSGEKVTTEGVYQVTITDAAGNVLAVTLEVDKTAPTPIITAEDGTVIAANGSINQAFVVTGETGATITYSASGSSYTTYDGGYLSDAGTHYFKITDLAGNRTEFTVTCDYVVNYSISGNYNTVDDNYYISNSTLTLIINETYTSFVVTSNNAVTFSSGEKISTEGVYNVTVIDAAGNVLALTLEIDKTAPEPIITAEDGTIIAANGSINQAFVVTGETGATITYSASGSSYTIYNGAYLSDAGAHYFKIMDLAGNVTEFTVTCDYAVKYTLSGTYNVLDDDNYISNSTLTLTVAEAYSSFLVASDNGVTFSSGENITDEGVYTVTITDVAGNVLTVTIEIDKTAPTPIITAEDGTAIAANGSVNQAFVVTAEDGAAITYSASGTGYAAYNGWYLSAEGAHYFRITDVAGNKTEFTVTCDYVVNYSIGGNYNTVEDNYYISKTSLTLTVNESYVSFSVSSENGVTFASGETVATEGVYQVTITDVAGNVLTVTLEVDKTAPTPIITAEDGTLLEAGCRVNQAFNVTSEESTAAITYSATGTSYGTYRGAYLADEGTYYFRITDIAGNTAEFTVTCDYVVKYTVSGDYSLISDVYYISKTALTLTVNETYEAFLVNSDNGVTFGSGEKISVEGVYNVTIIDAAGNVLTVTLEVDKTAPTPTITTESGESLEADSSVNQAFVVTAEDGAAITYSYGGTSYAAYSGGYLSEAGVYSFRITDAAGNRTEFTVTCDYVVKYTISGTYNTVTDDYYISKTALTLTVNEDYVYFSVLSQNDVTFANAEKVTTEGVYIVTIIDEAGNVVEVTLEIDKTAPEITLTGVTEGAVTTSSVTVAFSDDVNESYYSLGGVKTELENGGLLTDDGAYVITVTDWAGNKTTAAFTIDTIVSVTTSRELVDGQLITGNITFTFNEKLTASLTRDGAEIKYSGGKIAETGVYQLGLTDAYGNTLSYSFSIIAASAQSYALSAAGYEVEAVKDGALYTLTYAEDGGFTLTEDGEYELTFTAEDGAEYTLQLTVDSVAPTVDIAQTKSSVVISNPSKTVTVALYKDGEEVEYKLGDEITDNGEYTLIVCDELGNSNTYYFTINYINAYGFAVIGVACSAAAGIGFALVMYRKKRSVR